MTTGYIDLPADVGGTVDLATEVTGILPIANGGTGSATQNFVDLTTAQTVAGAKTFTGTPTAFTPGASVTASTARFLFTGASDVTLTASTEAPNVYFNMSQTRQHSTGTLSNQRDFRISPSTHSFVGASTLTNAASLVIDGPSNGGTNATITNSSALWVPTSALTNVTNSYGLNVAATTGATNNYAGIFTGGNIGVGSFTPTSLIHMVESNSATGNSNGLTIEQSGTGDASAHFLLSGVQRYTMGIDNSDSDKFKIGTNADLGSNNLLTVTTAGNVGIGTTTPASLFNVNNGSLTVDGGSVGTQPINGARLLVDAGPSVSHVLMKVRNSSVDAVTVLGTGNVGIGTSSPNANAILDVVSTTKAFMPPRMTTAQKTAIASPTAGMVVYDSTLAKLCIYTTAWETVTSI